MRPKVILHNGISADGRLDWLQIDLGLYYGVIGRWHEDATLAGSGTLLAPLEEIPAEVPADLDPPAPVADDPRPILVVADSRGQVRTWHYLRKQPYWRNWVALCTQSTPQEHLDYLRERQIDTIVAGADRIDFALALDALNTDYGVQVVRADSGGTLNGVLLRAGLVDEVSVIVHPSLVGGSSPKSIFHAADLQSADGVIPLRLIHCEQMDGGCVWLVYQVVKQLGEGCGGPGHILVRRQPGVVAAEGNEPHAGRLAGHPYEEAQAGGRDRRYGAGGPRSARGIGAPARCRHSRELAPRARRRRGDRVLAAPVAGLAPAGRMVVLVRAARERCGGRAGAGRRGRIQGTPHAGRHGGDRLFRAAAVPESRLLYRGGAGADPLGVRLAGDLARHRANHAGAAAIHPRAGEARILAAGRGVRRGRNRLRAAPRAFRGRVVAAASTVVAKVCTRRRPVRRAVEPAGSAAEARSPE